LGQGAYGVVYKVGHTFDDFSQLYSPRVMKCQLSGLTPIYIPSS
jgi:hypothetical protein